MKILFVFVFIEATKIKQKHKIPCKIEIKDMIRMQASNIDLIDAERRFDMKILFLLNYQLKISKEYLQFKYTIQSLI